MNKNIRFAIFVTLMLLQTIHLFAISTTILLDRSGSMEAMSSARNVKSLDKVKKELVKYAEQIKGDTVTIVSFTDKIVDEKTISEYNEDVRVYINSLVYPKKGDTNILNPLKTIINSENRGSQIQRIVIISDGLHNCGEPEKELLSYISSVKDNNNVELYFLLLDDKDRTNPIVDLFDKTPNLYLIKSLSELHDVESANLTDTVQAVKAEKSNTTQIVSNCENANAFDFSIIIWIVCVVFIILVICGIIYFIAQILPLFTMNSISAMQKAIPVLYNLPKPLYNIIFKILPYKMRDYIIKNMPKYENYKRGVVIAQNEAQQKILDLYKKITGHDMRYKNGTVDFRRVAKFRVKLKGGLNSYIPKGGDPRSKISVAQEKAAYQMLSTEDGRQTIAKYVKKNPKDVTIDDYRLWKDDALNAGTPNHNPLTPHETIDGKYIEWVPKKFHDANWGGIPHTGGVSMVKSLRSHFGMDLQ